jgi:hypothetical protein
MAGCFRHPGKASRNLLKELGSSISFGDFSEYGKYKIFVTYIINVLYKILQQKWWSVIKNIVL